MVESERDCIAITTYGCDGFTIFRKQCVFSEKTNTKFGTSISSLRPNLLILETLETRPIIKLLVAKDLDLKRRWERREEQSVGRREWSRRSLLHFSRGHCLAWKVCARSLAKTLMVKVLYRKDWTWISTRIQFTPTDAGRYFGGRQMPWKRIMRTGKSFFAIQPRSGSFAKSGFGMKFTGLQPKTQQLCWKACRKVVNYGAVSNMLCADLFWLSATQKSHRAGWYLSTFRGGSSRFLLYIN